MAFVSGQADTGKTALVTEFTRRAQAQHMELVVAVGQGDAQAAELILSAIQAVTGEGRVLTPDVGGRARTVEVGDEVVRRVRMGPSTSQGK